MISIIIPVYNAALYLRRCLDSVLAQTYGQWETICVDDGSTDSSLSILEEYANKDGRFKVASQKNGGASAARNTGIRMAEGDYVFFLDSDDELSVDCLALMSAEVDKYPGIEMVVGSHMIIGQGVSKTYSYCEPCCFWGNNRIRYAAFKDDSQFNIVPWNRLISLAFLKRESICFKEGIIHEDDHWAFYIYKKLASLSVIDAVTYYYHETPNSVMSTNTQKKRGETFYVILCDWVKGFDEPFRPLLVFKSLEYYRNFVLPCVSKNKNRKLYFRFFFELVRLKLPKVAFYWLVNWFVDFRHYKLYYSMIPDAYRAEGEKQAAEFGMIN